MSYRVGFFIQRVSMIKSIGSLIDEALRRNHDAHIFLDSELNASTKSYENVTQATLIRWASKVQFHELPFRQWLDLACELRLHTVYSEAFYSFLFNAALTPAAKRLREKGTRLVSISHLWENALEVPESHELIDLTFYWSEEHRQAHQRIFPEAKIDSSRTAVAGSTMFDQMAAVDRDVVRKKYGIAAGQPVVVFFSLKMNVGDPWRLIAMSGASMLKKILRATAAGRFDLLKELYQGPSYRQLMQAIRSFCDKQGAKLIVKSKQKNADPSFVHELADAVILEDSVYPYTSMELIAISNLCIHFGSAAALETAFANVPSVSIRVSMDHVTRLAPKYAAYWSELRGKPPTPSMFDSPGVVWALERGDFYKRIKEATLETWKIDSAARKNYIERFIGYEDMRSAVRVFDEVESAIEMAVPQPARSFA